jgi:hypothetical protein
VIAVLAALRQWGPASASDRLGTGAVWLKQRLGIQAAQDAVSAYVSPTLAHLGDSVYNGTQWALEGIARSADNGWSGLRSLPGKAWKAVADDDNGGARPDPKTAQDNRSPSPPR